MSGLHPIVVCRRCGRHGPGRLAGGALPALCRSCLAYERKPKTRCRVCGTVTVERVRPGHDGDLCDDCVPPREERVCGVCGRVGPLAIRATDTSPAIGPCCYRPPVATCSQCGREQPCYHAGDPQRAICLGCASRRTTIVTCLDCGKPRAAHRRVEGGAICATCDRRRGNTIGVCTGCGERAPLRRDRCDRCRLRAAVDELADTGDPAAVAALAPFLESMAAARNPASMLRWMQTPTFWVTRRLTTGEIEVSHAGLDAVAPLAPQAVGFVRAQLVGCGVLETRDEPSAAFAAWHAKALERIEPGSDRAHVRAYATWQVAHQLARTSQSGRPTVSAQKYARSLVSEAIKLTRWLHDQQLELRDLRQDLLDAWIADGPGIRRRARLFVAWLQRARITGALHVDWPYDFPQRAPLQDERRFAMLRRLLHDREISLRERFVGSVLLLYGQPLTRIAQLRTSDITTTASDEAAITFARGAIALPEPLASSRSPFATNASPTAKKTAGCSPDGSPGATSPPSTCASGWRPTASPAAAAATARCWRSRADSRHRSSPSASASTKPAPRNGLVPPAPPTRLTSSFARSGARIMDEQREQALHGGRQTVDIVRVGDTVRRPQHARSDFAHAVLRHLNAAGFNGAPRLLGIDEHGREVISYINGETIDSSPARLSDARLVSAAGLVRRFHDATAGTALAAAQEIVAHGDLGPHNIVFSGDTAVAIVDWDHDVAPGSRLVDFGHAVWCCADVCEPDIPVAEQARKVRLMCDAYGWDNPPAVIDEIAERFQRARNNHAAHQRHKAVAVFDEMIAWMQRHAPELKAAL